MWVDLPYTCPATFQLQVQLLTANDITHKASTAQKDNETTKKNHLLKIEWVDKREIKKKKNH